MSSDALKEIIDVGNDTIAIKYYGLAVAVVLFYDFLLTLSDEVEFAWHGRKSWVFGIFLANRYLPMGYQFWALITAYRPTFSQRICDKTAFFSVLAFVGSTLLTQVVLTLRVYAATGKNRVIASYLGTIMISQFIFGMYMTAVVATEGAQQVLPIPLDAYTICSSMRYKVVLELVFTSMSLVYDLSAFLLIVYVALRYQFQMPGLFKTIARDSTSYFLVIFTSHLLLELTLLFARPGIQVLAGTGNVVYLPVMINRLMLSLKKAITSREQIWSLGEPTINIPMKFPGHRGLVTIVDEIRLDEFSSRGEEAQSQA